MPAPDDDESVAGLPGYREVRAAFVAELAGLDARLRERLLAGPQVVTREDLAAIKDRVVQVIKEELHRAAGSSAVVDQVAVDELMGRLAHAQAEQARQPKGQS